IALPFVGEVASRVQRAKREGGIGLAESNKHPPPHCGLLRAKYEIRKPVMTVRNPARERSKNGELCLGIGLRQARTVDIAAAMASCGFDWLFIDLEHGTMPLDIAVQISCAALTAGITPLVRVPSGQYALATRALDGGALGIVMPHVDTAEEARVVVDHLKYPPLGHRSMAGGMGYFGL